MPLTSFASWPNWVSCNKRRTRSSSRPAPQKRNHWKMKSTMTRRLTSNRKPRKTSWTRRVYWSSTKTKLISSWDSSSSPSGWSRLRVSSRETARKGRMLWGLRQARTRSRGIKRLISPKKITKPKKISKLCRLKGTKRPKRRSKRSWLLN